MYLLKFWRISLLKTHKLLPLLFSRSFLLISIYLEWLINGVRSLPYNRRILKLKFRIIVASHGCNWEVVYLGKSTSLMFLRFLWGVSKCNGELSRNSKTFQFLRSNLWSKTGRAWILTSLQSILFCCENTWYRTV